LTLVCQVRVRPGLSISKTVPKSLFGYASVGKLVPPPAFAVAAFSRSSLAKVNPVRAGVVYLRPKQVVFVRSTGPYAVSSVAAWDAMLAWINRHNLTREVTCGYGLALDHSGSTRPEDFRYDACIALPDGFIAPREDALPFETLPGGAFARIRHTGRYETVGSSITLIRDQWLSAQPHLLIDRRRPMMTIYLGHPTLQDVERLRCDVCIPVRTGHEEAFKRCVFNTSQAA